jgi:hypothetical protein
LEPLEKKLNIDFWREISPNLLSRMISIIKTLQTAICLKKIGAEMMDFTFNPINDRWNSAMI